MVTPHSRLIDITHQRFGRLTVLHRYGSIRTHRHVPSSTAATWVCRCDCGGERIARSDHLRDGRVSSCGHCSTPPAPKIIPKYL